MLLVCCCCCSWLLSHRKLFSALRWKRSSPTLSSNTCLLSFYFLETPWSIWGSFSCVVWGMDVTLSFAKWSPICHSWVIKKSIFAPVIWDSESEALSGAGHVHILCKLQPPKFPTHRRKEEFLATSLYWTVQAHWPGDLLSTGGLSKPSSQMPAESHPAVRHF